jgi:hypothetical protein
MRLSDVTYEVLDGKRIMATFSTWDEASKFIIASGLKLTLRTHRRKVG